MISLALVAAAFALFYGVDVKKLRPAMEWVRKIEPQKLAAVALLLVALAVMWWPAADEQPTPEPDAGPLVLRGMFVSPTASDDASLIGALCHELADEIEFDGSQPTPYLATGVAVDELRKAARILRCRGVSIGDRQPKARAAIAKYLDEKVGTDGGPLTPEVRAAWVAAYRDIGRAATDAAK